jgi:hypothetical protein
MFVKITTSVDNSDHPYGVGLDPVDPGLPRDTPEYPVDPVKS